MDLLTYITLAVALLPTIVIMLIVIKNARAEKEPFKKLAAVFAISALSTIPAIILELIGGSVLDRVLGGFGIAKGASDNATAIYEFFELFFVVGLFEEACKYFTFKWIIFNDRDFDNTYDGVIYGACSALGFATLENLGYIFLNGGGLSVAIMRAVLSIPMHAVTGIVMGYHFGVTKYRRYNNLIDTHPERKAFVFSVILHGIYDLLATLPSIYNTILPFAGLLVVMIFIYATMGRTIKRAKRESHNIYNRYYYEQLGGQYQDMKGGKTTSKKVFGMPLPPMGTARQQFDPYQPYQNIPQGMPPSMTQSGSMGFPNPTAQYAPPPTQTENGGQGVYGNAQQNMPQQPVYSGGQPYNGGNANVYSNTDNYSTQPQRSYTVSPVRTVQPVQEPEKYCGNCGAKMSAEAKFCPICGSKT